MKLAENIRSVSYLKDNIATLVKTLPEERSPLIVTHNGEAKLVVMDIKSYEETQETIALLKLLAISEKEKQNGEYLDLDDAINEIIK
jgi:prevent-host-death family protein